MELSMVSKICSHVYRQMGFDKIKSNSVDKESLSVCYTKIIEFHMEKVNFDQYLAPDTQTDLKLIIYLSIKTWCLSQSLSRWRICLQCRRHRRHGLHPWIGKIPWRRKWESTPVFLPGESHGQRSLVGYSSKGLKKSDVDWAQKHKS